MDVGDPGSLIPEGLELPPTRCVHFDPVEDDRYALRRGEYDEASGVRFRLLAGTHPEHADALDEMLSGLRFWAVVLEPGVERDILIYDGDDEEPSRDAAPTGAADDGFDAIRRELEAMDPGLREMTEVVLLVDVVDTGPRSENEFVLWGIDPEVRDGRGHKYKRGGDNIEVSIDLQKHTTGRVLVEKANGTRFHVGPNHRAEKFGARNGCTVWGDRQGQPIWSEYHISGCGELSSYVSS
jgi:hypothetical protein